MSGESPSKVTFVKTRGFRRKRQLWPENRRIPVFDDNFSYGTESWHDRAALPLSPGRAHEASRLSQAGIPLRVAGSAGEGGGGRGAEGAMGPQGGYTTYTSYQKGWSFFGTEPQQKLFRVRFTVIHLGPNPKGSGTQIVRFSSPRIYMF